MNIVELSGRKKDKLIQFALDSRKAKLEKLKWPLLWSEKLDGVFCLAVKVRERLSPISTGEVVHIFSRTGETYTSMPHIQTSLQEAMHVNEVILFEAYTPGVVQATISGWCRDTKETHEELQAYCHTLLTLDEFLNGGKHPFIDCHLELEDRFYSCSQPLSNLHYIGQYWVENMKDAMEFTQAVWDRGGEGGVLRNPHALYAPGKRNMDILKLKKGVSYDLKVLGVLEGEGKYKGTLGALLCKWKNCEGDPNWTQTIRISGMTDAQREEWWKVPDKIIGKIVQVDAMCESAKGLLREPRFKGIRYDKTEGDF